MKTDFSKRIKCNDGHEREFHFARVNSAAIYYHVSVIDTDGKLITATLFIDDNGQWKIQRENFPAWFYTAEPVLAAAINQEEKQQI